MMSRAINFYKMKQTWKESILASLIGYAVLAIASAFRIVSFLPIPRFKKSVPSLQALSNALKTKYNGTALLYDLLDYPWELKYREWRPIFTGGMRGKVLELGVGTGRNIPYYSSDVDLIAVDLSERMLAEAKHRAQGCAVKSVTFCQGDATNLEGIVQKESVDWVLATFLFCVLPDDLQPPALEQIRNVLRIGSEFRLVGLKFSQISKYRAFVQWWYSPFVEWMYGAGFDRRTVDHIKATPGLEITRLYYVSKLDTHLVIEGRRVS